MRTRGRGPARRYARALLDVALQRGEDERLAQDLRETVALLEAQAELSRFLTHPAVSSERKRAVVDGVWKKSGNDLLLRLLHLLASRERLGLLPEVALAYLGLWNAHRGVVTAEVLTAVPLDAQGQGRLGAALGRAAGGRTVELQAQLDPSLLGGVMVKMEGRVYDASLRGRLRALRRHLLGREVA